MRIEDLMVGDWVSNVDGTIVGRVESLDSAKNRVVFGDHTLDADFVYPLILTQDILNKSRFECRKETRVACYDLRQDKATVYLEIKDPLEHEWLCVIGRHYPTSWRCRIEMKVHEVHELQNALKLCGIEKEIVL